MDVTSPVGRFRILSTTAGSILCAAPTDDTPSCRSIRLRQARRSSAFGFVLLTPDEVLHRIGAPDGAVDVSPATASVADGVECFHATGPGGHVEWCYSADGLLLSLLFGSATDGWTSLEAVSVSRGVTEGAFESVVR